MIMIVLFGELSFLCLLVTTNVYCKVTLKASTQTHNMKTSTATSIDQSTESFFPTTEMDEDPKEATSIPPATFKSTENIKTASKKFTSITTSSVTFIDIGSGSSVLTTEKDEASKEAASLFSTTFESTKYITTGTVPPSTDSKLLIYQIALGGVGFVLMIVTLALCCALKGKRRREDSKTKKRASEGNGGLRSRSSIELPSNSQMVRTREHDNNKEMKYVVVNRMEHQLENPFPEHASDKLVKKSRVTSTGPQNNTITKAEPKDVSVGQINPQNATAEVTEPQNDRVRYTILRNNTVGDIKPQADTVLQSEPKKDQVVGIEFQNDTYEKANIVTKENADNLRRYPETGFELSKSKKDKQKTLAAAVAAKYAQKISVEIGDEISKGSSLLVHETSPYELAKPISFENIVAKDKDSAM